MPLPDHFSSTLRLWRAWRKKRKEIDLVPAHQAAQAGEIYPVNYDADRRLRPRLANITVDLNDVAIVEVDEKDRAPSCRQRLEQHAQRNDD